jgi:DNA end-binding protein Ku
MAQAIWSGSIGFGLIGIPVKLYPATKRNDVRFHEVERATGRRVRHRRVVEIPDEPADDEPSYDDVGPSEEDASPRTIDDEPRETMQAEAQPLRREQADDRRSEREVPGEDLVKGYDLGDDRLVTVTAEELQALRPESTHTIELEEFVALREIDPVFFDRTYLVAAQPNAGAEKPYALLLHAMEEAERIGIGRFVMRTKEHLVALRPAEGALALETLFYQDEVRPLYDIPNLPVSASTIEREEKLALQLVETLTGEWSPERYRDPFRERVLDLIESKAGSARTAPREPAETATSRVSDLMEALKQSVEAAKEVRSDREASAS